MFGGNKDNSTGGTPRSPMEFKEECENVRKQIQPLVDFCNWFKKEHPHWEQDAVKGEHRSEMKANITLAMRHLEDARMRFGKAIQAYDGGVSVYDKK